MNHQLVYEPLKKTRKWCIICNLCVETIYPIAFVMRGELWFSPQNIHPMSSEQVKVHHLRSSNRSRNARKMTGTIKTFQTLRFLSWTNTMKEFSKPSYNNESEIPTVFATEDFFFDQTTKSTNKLRMELKVLKWFFSTFSLTLANLSFPLKRTLKDTTHRGRNGLCKLSPSIYMSFIIEEEGHFILVPHVIVMIRMRWCFQNHISVGALDFLSRWKERRNKTMGCTYLRN